MCICVLATNEVSSITLSINPAIAWRNEKNEHSIMQNTIAKDTLREYVKENEVVFQALDSMDEIIGIYKLGNNR